MSVASVVVLRSLDYSIANASSHLARMKICGQNAKTNNNVCGLFTSYGMRLKIKTNFSNE